MLATNDTLPAYLGIPLCIFLLTASITFIVMAITIWRDR